MGKWYIFWFLIIGNNFVFSVVGIVKKYFVCSEIDFEGFVIYMFKECEMYIEMNRGLIIVNFYVWFII